MIFQKKLAPVDLLESYDHFSHFDAVSIDGDYAVVGAHNYESGLYIIEVQGENFMQRLTLVKTQ